MSGLPTEPNPDLRVGDANKPGWNQPANRRRGFHNAHMLWRRVLMIRAQRSLRLCAAPDEAVARAVHASGLTRHPAFSALVIAQHDRILHASHAPDFAIDRPHSVQSVSKLFAHVVIGTLVAAGRIAPRGVVSDHLPWIGSAYAGARVQDVLDMNVANAFTEDYDDPASACYAEEQALGWRLAHGGQPEISLRDFVASLVGDDLVNRTGQALYKSANTDVLTLIAEAAGDEHPLRRLEAIADAAGFADGLFMSLSPEHLPAFSGGACLSAADLARLGLLIARGGAAISGPNLEIGGFTRQSMQRAAPGLGLDRPGMRYSNHVMTNGQWVGHAGYGGQFLMIDMGTGRVAAYLSVLENASGHDRAYLNTVIASLEAALSCPDHPG